MDYTLLHLRAAVEREPVMLTVLLQGERKPRDSARVSFRLRVDRLLRKVHRRAICTATAGTEHRIRAHLVKL